MRLYSNSGNGIQRQLIYSPPHTHTHLFNTSDTLHLLALEYIHPSLSVHPLLLVCLFFFLNLSWPSLHGVQLLFFYSFIHFQNLL